MMDAKLERVIKLAAQLQDAIKECDCVLGCNFTKFLSLKCVGIHVYKPDMLGLPGLKLDYTDKNGDDWVRTSIRGVAVYGRVIKEGTSNE